jgi:hypothetical protein
LESEKQFRLLEHHAGKSEDTLEAHLISVDIGNAPSYTAVSYVWGSPGCTASISIAGKMVWIRSNLLDALHALRATTHNRLIWADVICINQANMVERNHQVAMMGQIYGTADNVTVYLGQPTEHTEEGMLSLRSLMDLHTLGEGPPWSDIALPKLEKDLADILSRPWFTRVWTIQEAALARNTTLMCGQYYVTWHGDIRTMRAIVFRIKSTVISPLYSLGDGHTSTLDWYPLLSVFEAQMKQAARREGVVLHRTHLDLAYEFRHQQSAYFWDRIYAILGILESDQGAELRFGVDYSRPTEELLSEFAAEVRRIGEIQDVRLTDAL